MKQSLPDPLRELPGVGPKLADKLRSLGCERPGDLVGQAPEDLYQRLMEQEGGHVDRCVLYVFRCAVHFADQAVQGRTPSPGMLKWWNWKDGG